MKRCSAAQKEVYFEIIQRQPPFAVLFSALLLMYAICDASEYAMSDMEWKTDRYGSDYAVLDLRLADPTLCEEACATDTHCRAWTYITPNTVQGPRPRCWLKNSVPETRPCLPCVSGVKIRIGVSEAHP